MLPADENREPMGHEVSKEQWVLVGRLTTRREFSPRECGNGCRVREAFSFWHLRKEQTLRKPVWSKYSAVSETPAAVCIGNTAPVRISVAACLNLAESGGSIGTESGDVWRTKFARRRIPTAFTCRAACNGVVSRETKMAARSGATPRSAHLRSYRKAVPREVFVGAIGRLIVRQVSNHKQEAMHC